jgi:exonuclease SbcC
LQPDFIYTDINSLEKIRKEKQTEYSNVSDIIKQAKDIEKQIITIRDVEIPALQQAKQTTEQKKKEAEIAQKLAEQSVENQKNIFAEKQKEKETIEKDKEILTTERKNIFDEKSVDDEEKRLKNSVSVAEKERNEAEKSKTVAFTEIEKIKAVALEKEKELSEKENQKVTEETLDELQTASVELKTKSEELSQKIGANRQALITNDKNLAHNRQKLAEKESQQQVCNRWGNLNELIGSADGKKYRNFAQALTFEHLIGLANRQLQKMSERYLLKRVGDAANPFELAVIDKYQNCGERTAQNLSGGEKFIVSLSLALGLSNMASRNMRIDTMFIDEGFGTLDADYLDVALSALSNLQNEGKLIGVISHLAELKERIATHIEITPQGNGHSRMEVKI